MLPEAQYQITRAEYITEPDVIKIKNLIRLFSEHYLPKRNTYHNRGDFFGKINGRGITRKTLKTNRNRKRMQLQHNLSRRNIDVQILTAITDKKLQEKLMKKTLELKETIELIKQNTYGKKNKKNTITETLSSAKEKHVMKEKPIQRMERFGAKPKNRPTGNKPCKFCGASNWTPAHMYPAKKT